jgi:hypothetical protein
MVTAFENLHLTILLTYPIIEIRVEGERAAVKMIAECNYVVMTRLP